ncbi:hypothetical protein VB735_12620 [Halotia wernerae UHCC 0503]|nr:hypothetical protein [Halotia wernerae UHCC 0503]
MNNDSVQKILLLAANPIGSKYLRLIDNLSPPYLNSLRESPRGVR